MNSVVGLKKGKKREKTPHSRFFKAALGGVALKISAISFDSSKEIARTVYGNSLFVVPFRYTWQGRKPSA